MLGVNAIDDRDILLGAGKLLLNGIDAGQLSGNVVFTPSAEYKDFKAGIPQMTLKSTKYSEDASLKASYAELNYKNTAMAIGSDNMDLTTMPVTDESIKLYSDVVASVSKNRYISNVVVTIPAAAIPQWQATHAYALDAYVQPTVANGKRYKVTTAGTSGADEPTWPTTVGQTVTDGTVTFTCEDAIAEVVAVADTDYTIVNAAAGQIKRVQTSTLIKDGDTVKVDYKYISKAVIKSGGNTSTPVIPVQFIYESPDGDEIITITFYKAKVKTGQAITFKADDYSINDIEITALADPSRPAGDQLYNITYEYPFGQS